MCCPKEQKEVKAEHKNVLDFEIPEQFDDCSILGEVSHAENNDIDGHVIELDDQVVILFTSNEAEEQFHQG